MTQQPTNTKDLLYQQWNKQLAKFGSKTELANQYFFYLCEQLTKPKRYYHNLQHINYVLQTIQKFYPGNTMPDVLFFASWYHDAIHHAQSKTNEEDSAELAASSLPQLNIPKEIIRLVVDIILATKDHELKGNLKNDKQSREFLDADLAILAEDEIQYFEYVQKIRQEYGFCTDSQFINGRKNVILHLLDKEAIYLSDKMKSREQIARNNLENELRYKSFLK